MRNDTRIRDSSGNVFHDMGMLDAEERLAKAELARLIRLAIRDRGMTQADAAELLGVTRPDVSDLVRGSLARFSMARLAKLLNRLDLEIRILVGPRPPEKACAGISVHSVDSFQGLSPSPMGALDDVPALPHLEPGETGAPASSKKRPNGLEGTHA
jgi:predicted XRE-type DNA-binding protein